VKHVEIYTDGACSGNPGPGGWGAVLIYKGTEREISGYSSETTNNRMELMAAIQGLNALKESCRVSLYTDSAYLCNAFNNGWTIAWQRNGWQNAKKKPVENKELWMMLINKSKEHQITWIKVKGHSDNEYNNRADKLAVAEIKKNKKEAKPEEIEEKGSDLE
jgi:ribonuclease HI